MQVIPLPTPLLHSGDALADILLNAGTFADEDILVVSSKAVTTVEGGAIDLGVLQVSNKAEEWATRTGASAAFCQAVLEETARYNGKIVGNNPHIMVTELQPEHMEMGTLLVANAGLDSSNVEAGYAMGWPKDAVASLQALREALEKNTGKRIAVILSDSCCQPRRLGVTAYALAVSGFDPIVSEIGALDLFGKKMRMTYEAVADQLAVAANFHMGNTSQSTPAAIIRGHGLSLSNFVGWVPGVDPDEDLFKGAL